jgi:hypothetical protein
MLDEAGIRPTGGADQNFRFRFRSHYAPIRFGFAAKVNRPARFLQLRSPVRAA